MKKFLLKNNKGFTLAEILVYIAIFTVISVAVINSYVVILSSFSSTRTARDLLESGNTAMERISREIRQAKSIDVTNSVGTVFQMNSTDSSNNPEVVKFYVLSGALNLYYNNVLDGNLLGQNISITSLVFRRITTTQGEAVKIEMTLQDLKSKTLRSENFYDTVILRGEY